MPKLADYDGIEIALPDFNDWLDVELVGAKNDRTYNLTPLQIATVAQDGMAADDATWPIASVTGLQDALDAKRDAATPIPVVSTDAGNVITAGADGLAFLSSALLLPEGPDLSGYATVVYVDAAVASVDLSPYATTAAVAEAVQTSDLNTAATYATIATVSALDASVEAQLSAIADALEGI